MRDCVIMLLCSSKEMFHSEAEAYKQTRQRTRAGKGYTYVTYVVVLHVLLVPSMIASALAGRLPRRHQKRHLAPGRVAVHLGYTKLLCSDAGFGTRARTQVCCRQS